MRPLLLLPLLATGGSATSTRAPVFEPLGDAQRLFAPVPFDFYVLAQSWQPEFCSGKEHQYPGCVEPNEFWRSHFTMHGLWPELTSGKHPDFCGGPPFDLDSIDKAIGRDVLTEFWPNVKSSADSPSYSDFWKHEWTRHGACSGLDQVMYFSAAVNLIRNGTAATPDLIQQNLNKTVSADALRSAYGDEPVALKCVHGGILSQIFSCWDKDSAHRPTSRRACPDHIIEEDTCTKPTVFIPAFP